MWACVPLPVNCACAIHEGDQHRAEVGAVSGSAGQCVQHVWPGATACLVLVCQEGGGGGGGGVACREWQ